MNRTNMSKLFFIICLCFLSALSALPLWAQAPGDIGSRECREAQIEAQLEAQLATKQNRPRGQAVSAATKVVGPLLASKEITGACSSCIMNQIARQIPTEEQEACGPDCGDCPCDFFAIPMILDCWMVAPIGPFFWPGMPPDYECSMSGDFDSSFIARSIEPDSDGFACIRIANGHNCTLPDGEFELLEFTDLTQAQWSACGCEIEEYATRFTETVTAVEGAPFECTDP